MKDEINPGGTLAATRFPVLFILPPSSFILTQGGYHE